MKTLYSLLLDRCGLSHREAAAYHRVRLDTVKSWSAGRNKSPAGAIAELRDLYRAIETAAGELVKLAAETRADQIEIGLSADDYEAQSLGWPCVGVHAAAIGIAAARLGRRLIIVPRGTTAATAAAVDANENLKEKRLRP